MLQGVLLRFNTFPFAWQYNIRTRTQLMTSLPRHLVSVRKFRTFRRKQTY